MKLLVILSLAMSAMLAAVFLVFRASPAVEPCEEHPIAEARSAGHLAAVTRRTCGGAVTTHVRMDPGRAGREGAEVFAAADAAPVTLRWQDGKVLVIETSGKVLRDETRFRDVQVRVSRVR